MSHSNFTRQPKYSLHRAKKNVSSSENAVKNTYNEHNYPWYKSYIILLLPLLFFAFQFILRLWQSLTVNQMMFKLGVDAAGFGIVAASYYWGYAGMQLPLAAIIDRFGPRSVISACAAICGLSFALFNSTSNVYLAILFRIIIGASSASAFLGVSKVISCNFSPNKYAKFIGLSFSIGLIGAVFGGRPMAYLLDYYDIFNITMALSSVSVLLGVGIYLLVPELKSNNTYDKLQNNGIIKNSQRFHGNAHDMIYSDKMLNHDANESASMLEEQSTLLVQSETAKNKVLRDRKRNKLTFWKKYVIFVSKVFNFNNVSRIIFNKELWILGATNLLLVGVLEGFADVWGVPFLTIAHNIDKAESAGIISWIFIGMLFGGPILALLSDKIGEYKVIILSAFCISLMFFVILIDKSNNLTWLSFLCLSMGICCCYQVVILSKGTKLVNVRDSNIAVAFLNCINMLGGSFFHPIIGIMLSYTSTFLHEKILAYKCALSIIPLSALLAAALLIIWRKRNNNTEYGNADS